MIETPTIDGGRAAYSAVHMSRCFFSELQSSETAWANELVCEISALANYDHLFALM